MSLRLRSTLLISAVAVAGLLASPVLDGARAAGPDLSTTVAVGAAAAQLAPAVQDPDRTSTTPTGWGWHPNASVATIKAWVKTGQRITDLELTKTSGKPKFSAAYVSNAGSYKRSWWWYYGLSAQAVKAKLKTNKARLIDIEPYTAGGKTRYAVVMVKNKGAAHKAWGWFSKSKLGAITAWAKKNQMRIVDSERFTVRGKTRYSAVLIKNRDADAASWWHYYGLSANAVKAKLKDKKARLINLERRADGKFDVIMTKGGFSGGWWYATGRTSAQVTDLINQVGGRPFMVDSQVVSGARRYDVLVLDNTDPETRRIRNEVYDKMFGKWGFYIKKVDGSVVAGLNADSTFEPASMIKIVHAVTALRDVQDGNRSVTSPVPWRQHPSFPARYRSDPGFYSGVKGVSNDKDVCAYDDDGNVAGTPVNDQLGPIILDYMLKDSDNRATDAITNLYGFEGLNDTIDVAGMTKSEMVHRIGCGTTWDRSSDYHNKLTLIDAGKIYEGVERTQLLDETRRADLYSYLGGGTINPGGALAAMIDEEGVNAGLSPAERRDFVGRVIARSKGGSYSMCPEPGDCDTSSLQMRTVGGIIFLPVRVAEGIDTVPYVYGRFFNVTVPCDFDRVSAKTCAKFQKISSGYSTLGVEIFRQPVREAIATW